MFKNKVRQVQQYKTKEVALIIQEIEIEIQRLIIEYQSEELLVPYETITDAGAEPAQALSRQPEEITPTLDSIMPLPQKKAKPKLSDVMSGNADANQIRVEEAIAAAEGNVAQAAVSPVAVAVPATVTEKQAPEAEGEPEAARFGARLIEMVDAHITRKQDRKEFEAMCSALRAQVSNKVEPLKRVLQFLHEQYAE